MEKKKEPYINRLQKENEELEQQLKDLKTQMRLKDKIIDDLEVRKVLTKERVDDVQDSKIDVVLDKIKRLEEHKELPKEQQPINVEVIPDDKHFKEWFELAKKIGWAIVLIMGATFVFGVYMLYHKGWL